ncbi:MAG TPA: CopD family protein [Gaiellaceae bacterium]|nr:CopD family protein [Gaiellaceae bacterium]
MKRQRSIALCAAMIIALAAAPTAAAHAVLVATTPGNDAVLQQSPDRVTLRFNEPVETAFGSVRVYDGNANRVDSGEISRPDEKSVAVAIDRRLPRGTYTVTWRAISADSHPVSGAFVFHVGAPGAQPGGIASEVFHQGTPDNVTWLYRVSRFFDFAFLLLVAGGAASLVLALASAPDDLRNRLYKLLAVFAAALVLSALAGIVLQGAVAGGFGVGEAAHWDTVSAVLDTRFGKTWLVQAALAAAVACLALVRPLRPVVLIPAAALVVTPSVSGHASVSGTLSFVADVVHVAAASAWTGGLAFLVLGLLLAGEQRWPLAARAVPRFSTLAVGAVAVLVTVGIVNAYEQVRAWRGLWETTYGQLLLAKIALVLPLLALGAYNNRFAVPRLRREVASPLEQRRFLRAAGAELAIFVAIVGVTAVLVTEPPAKASVVRKGPYATTTDLGPLELNFVADPAKAGRNELHLYLLDKSGRPADVNELRVLASLPSQRIGPLRFTARRLAPGHFAVLGVQLTIPGDWQFRVEARRGEFTSYSQTVSVPIRKD